MTWVAVRYQNPIVSTFHLRLLARLRGIIQNDEINTLVADAKTQENKISRSKIYQGLIISSQI